MLKSCHFGYVFIYPDVASFMQNFYVKIILFFTSENIAYKRPCRQKEGQASQNASLAVDDETDTCSATKADVPGWWTLTLDDVKLIESFTLVTGKIWVFAYVYNFVNACGV